MSRQSNPKFTVSTEQTCHVVDTNFRRRLGEDDLPPQSGRYHLFTAKLCPFAHRVEIMRFLKGLTQCIGLTITDPVQTKQGWDMTAPVIYPETVPNPVTGASRVPDLYKMSSPGYSGRASVPVLFDTSTGTIVNNESADIILQLNSAFDQNAQCGSPEVDLFPRGKRTAIKGITKQLAVDFIGPLYEAGFAREQQYYETCFDRVFASLEWLEHLLADQRPYLSGDSLTLADVHAFPHLVRFDPVFYSLYRLNLRRIADYPNLRKYTARLWLEPAFRDTTDLEAIERGYYLSWNQPSPLGIVPKGPAANTQGFQQSLVA